MRLGGTVCCNEPDQWEERLVESGFRAITAPFTCESSRDEVERFLEITRRHDVLIAEAGVWRNPFDPARGRENMEYAKRQLALADSLGIPCCVNIAGTDSPAGCPPAKADNRQPHPEAAAHPCSYMPSRT